MNMLKPLNLPPFEEVQLPRSPLACVLAQARFPPILAIRNPEFVAGWQEKLRETYPHLHKEEVHSMELSGREDPKVARDLIWRLADREEKPHWRVSLGVSFVTLETKDYDSRTDFLDRLRDVVTAVEEVFRPVSASRLGVRYVDRLTDEAVDHIGDLVHSEVLGIIQPAEDNGLKLRDSVVGVMTQVQFMAQDGFSIHGRWGRLPEDVSYDHDSLEPTDKPSWILDLDMSTTASRPFESEILLDTARNSAETLYRLFRHMVNERFLEFFGAKP